MAALPAEINIITLNCWGLKYISKLRSERLDEIGRRLAVADPPPHIVALQECWTQDDYRRIRRETRFALPYGKFYHSGVFGGGLAILSRWPIQESTMFRYPLNGRPTAFFRGDWFVGKGVACAKIRFGPGLKDVIEVFNTHEPNDSYACHRAAQAWEMAKLLRGAADRGHLVIGLGDFNAVPQSLPYRLITAHAPVYDAWQVVHPDSVPGPADAGPDSDPEKARRSRHVPTAEFNVRENGVTSDSVYNTWRWPASRQKALGLGKTPITVPPGTPDPRAKRLDYIFAGDGSPSGFFATGISWAVTRAEVGMLEPHPALGCSLSDHFSVEVTLALRVEGDDDDEHQHQHQHQHHHNHAHRQRDKPGPSYSGESLNVPGADVRDEVMMQKGAYLQSPVTSEFRISSELDDRQRQQQQQQRRREEEEERQEADRRRKRTTASSSAPLLLPASAYDEILGLIHRYAARERTQQRWRGAHFFAAVAVAVACLVAVWFADPRPAAFVLVLLAGLGLAAGTVDGLIALLFVNTELRALHEFEWEVMNAKSACGGV